MPLHRRLVLAGGLAALAAPATLRAQTRKKLLFLTHPALYKHDSLTAAETAMVELGRAGGYDVTAKQGYLQAPNAIDLSFLTPAYLGGFDGLMLMTNGNLPLTPEQKQMLTGFVRGGKALVGAHCATLTNYDTPEIGAMWGGYYLRSIVPTNQISAANTHVLKVDDRTNPATKGLGATWAVADEFYEFGRKVWDPATPTENVSQVGRLHIPLAFQRDQIHPLLSLDTSGDLTGLPGVVKGGDYPQAWTKPYGQGKVFYTALGHRTELWSGDQTFRGFMNGGARWALGLER